MGKKYTLTALKRDAASRNISFELVERFGKTGDAIPERLRGIREVAKVNTVAISLRSEQGPSELRCPAASLVEYTGDSLTIYTAGMRDPNTEEQKCLDEAKRIVHEYEQKCPYSSAYWVLKDYYKNCAYPWMGGFEKVRGKKCYNGLVHDDAMLSFGRGGAKWRSSAPRA